MHTLGHWELVGVVMTECPHCGYRDAWDEGTGADYKYHSGEHGDFYKLPGTLVRNEYLRFSERDEKQLLGCPVCSKTFID